MLVEANGAKLSKHTGATAIDNRFPHHNLAGALTLLGFDPPPSDTDELLAWAIANWNIHNVPTGESLTNFIALS